MKLLKATFNRVNLTQTPVRYPMTPDANADVLQCLSEMPLHELMQENYGDISGLAEQFEKDGVFTHRYGEMEPTAIPSVELGVVNAFEFFVEVMPETVYCKQSTYMHLRGYVEGEPNTPEAKYHVVSTMTYKKAANETTIHLVDNALFCQDVDLDARALRARDGVYAYESMLEAIELEVDSFIDTRSSFHAGVKAFEGSEVSRAHYLARLVTAILQSEQHPQCDSVFGVEGNHSLVCDYLNFPNMAYHPIVRGLRNMGSEAHRTLCLDDDTLRQLFEGGLSDVCELEFKDLIKVRPVADAWDRSFDSVAAYTIMQYMHGVVANLGVQTLELEIDENGPVQPKYTVMPGMDKGAHTYADINSIGEDIYEQFECAQRSVLAHIDFNVNGISTVEVTVDGGETRVFEYASFASSYCNPLVSRDAQKPQELSEMYRTICEVIAQ